MHIVDRFQTELSSFENRNPLHPNPKWGTALELLLNVVTKVEERVSSWQSKPSDNRMSKWGLWTAKESVSVLKTGVGCLNGLAAWADTTAKKVIAVSSVLFASFIMSKAIDHVTSLTGLVQSVVVVLGVRGLSRFFYSRQDGVKQS